MHAHDVHSEMVTEMTVDRNVTTSKFMISGAMAANEANVPTTIIVPLCR